MTGLKAYGCWGLDTWGEAVWRGQHLGQPKLLPMGKKTDRNLACRSRGERSEGQFRLHLGPETRTKSPEAQASPLAGRRAGTRGPGSVPRLRAWPYLLMDSGDVPGYPLLECPRVGAAGGRAQHVVPLFFRR